MPGIACALLSETSDTAEQATIPHLAEPTAQGLQHEYHDLVIPRQDLLFTNFARPGRSAEIFDSKGLYQARFFNYRTSTPHVFIPAAGPGASTELSYGGVVHLGGLNNFTLDAGYVGGQLQWAEDDQRFNPRANQSADSWNVATDGGWWDRTLTTRVEYARSALQFPTGAGDTETKPGQALQAEVNIASGNYLDAGWFDRWVGTARYRSVDQDYYSLANLELVKGLNTAQLLLQSDYRGVGMGLEWTQEGACLPESCSAFEPTVNRSGLHLRYQFDQWQLPALGIPTLSARYFQVNQWQTQDVVWSQGYSHLQKNDEAGLNLLFAQHNWRWSLDYLVSDQNHWRESDGIPNRFQQPSDWRHQTWHVDMGWHLNDRFRLNLNAHWNNQLELEPANLYQYRTLGMQAHLGHLIRNVSLNMEYYFGYEANNVANPGQLETRLRSQTGLTQLTWQLQRLHGVRPSLDLYLRGTFNQQFNAGAALDSLQWAALLGFELSWGVR